MSHHSASNILTAAFPFFSPLTTAHNAKEQIPKPPTPAAPAPAPPPVVQTDSQAAQDAQAAARERQRRNALAAGGRAGTILTSPLGLVNPPDNAIAKTILGG